MARTLKSDKMLFVLTLLLVGTSLIMVFSASSVTALKYGGAGYFLQKQALWALLGIVSMSVAMHVDYREYRSEWVIWSLLAVTLVLLVLVLFSHPVNGTRRWIQIPGMGTLQPSELAKFVLILFTAAILDRRMRNVNRIVYALGPIALASGLLVGLILKQPDYGTSVVIVAAIGAMIFAAGLYFRYLVGLLLLVGPPAVYLVLSSPYRMRRIGAFMRPLDHAQDTAYQAMQSLIAIGSGGPFGLGLMQGMQKLSYLPEPHTDFIFAVIGEELGLIGTSLILVCFALITWRGLRVALLAPDRFGFFLAFGITMVIGIQALVNISVVIALLPTKGIPLPFVSNGGSSLFVSMTSMGILLNVSQHASGSAKVTSAEPSGWTLSEQEA